MPPGLPHRPPLAMRLWLFRRSRKGQGNGKNRFSRDGAWPHIEKDHEYRVA